MEPEILTREEVANLLKISPRQVSRFMQKNGLPFVQIGKFGKKYFLHQSVLEWAKSHEKTENNGTQEEVESCSY